jgi:bacterioferritin-associated ferredoxin
MHPLRPRSRRTTGSRRRRLWRAGRRASAWRLIGSDRRPGHRQLCARRVKELDRVAGGVLQQDLLAARSADGVVAEPQARGAQPLDVGRTRAARPNSPLLGRSGVVTDDDVRTSEVATEAGVSRSSVDRSELVHCGSRCGDCRHARFHGEEHSGCLGSALHVGRRSRLRAAAKTLAARCGGLRTVNAPGAVCGRLVRRRAHRWGRRA